MREYDLIIIGGGAAGLMAGGEAARRGHSVLLLEKMEKPARKVRITGKGRCNLTNVRPRGEFLAKVRNGAEFFGHSFASFDNERTIKFFERLGVTLTTERGGRVFPSSGKAWDIADALIRHAKDAGCEIRCHSRVTDILTGSETAPAFRHRSTGSQQGTIRNDAGTDTTGRIPKGNPGKIRRETLGQFPAAIYDHSINHTSGTGSGDTPLPRIAGVEIEQIMPSGQVRRECIACRNVLIATGGLSYPATGSTGDGYTLAHRLGHTINEVRPALTPLETDLPGLRTLAGLVLRNITATLLIDGKTAGQEMGEMEFTSVGLGGAIILRLSRDAVDALIEGSNVAISVDLKPALSVKTLSERIQREASAAGGRIAIAALLRKLMPKQLIGPFAESSGLNRHGEITSADTTKAETLARRLKEFIIPVTDYRPFEEAIVTAGGVALSEVNPLTMESLRVRGLYFAGEVLDIDADTGGYNLQVAFSTGYVAGQLLHDNSNEEAGMPLQATPRPASPEAKPGTASHGACHRTVRSVTPCTRKPCRTIKQDS